MSIIFVLACVIATHPAGNPDGRMLTVEQAAGQSRESVIPRGTRLYWDGEGNLVKDWNLRHRQPVPSFSLPSGDTDGISYGTSVSRNEFGIDGGVFPSPDGSRIAVYRKDERRVTLFPLYNIRSRTGDVREIRYPMAGMASEHVGLCVCDLEGNILSTLQVTDFDDERYLTGVSWSPDGKNIFVQVLARSQHEMHLNMYRAADGSFVRTILTESNDKWVEPEDPIRFVKGSHEFLYRTDNRDGFRSLYLCDTLGTIRRVTPCAADVAYVADDGRYVYYTSAEVSPVENHLFRVRIDRRRPGRPERLTFEEGWHSIDMSPDCTKFIDRYSAVDVPGVTLVRSTDGGRIIEKVAEARNPLEEYADCRVELGSVKSADGQHDNYYRLFYPRGFDPGKKYPLIVYVYGGPHTQLVRNSWLGGVRMWEMLMAQKGYVVYVQDNRGTPNHGAAYEKAISRRCGVAESEDQIAGISALLDRCPWIDRNRIGVHGWSYGGFMTLTLATGWPDMFKVAVAGGPVIDWKWYEVMYGERYMDTPETNPDGYAATSLIAKAPRLRSRTLVCQGGVDDVVVPQHALNFIEACIEAEVPVDFFMYPVEPHNMHGRQRVHLYEKITDYFETYL